MLFQLGGPDSLQAVEPFLLNLFLDPDIIPMGPLGFLRRPMAKMISSRRSIPVSAKYAEIGRRSPIGLLTERQRRALVKALSPDVDAVAVTAMRYWHPLTSEAIDELKQAGSLDEIVLLPLYPHFSYATTLSSLKEWNRVYGNAGAGPKVVTVSQFYSHPLYIQALVQRIGSMLRQFPDSSRIHLVFSAHGLPMSLVEKGDPYPKQIEETVRLVSRGWRKKYQGCLKTHLLCYWSRVEWPREVVAAAADAVLIERLGHEGVKEMLVVPISFVTEHIETLHEINIEARADATKVGIERFRMMPAVGDLPIFIEALRDLVLQAVGVEAAPKGFRPLAAQAPNLFVN